MPRSPSHLVPRLESRVIDGLVHLYSLAHRTGVWSHPLAERLFVRAYFAYKRWWEDPLRGLVRRRPDLFTGGHALDVGANVGYTALLLADAVEPEHSVWAFEPDAPTAGRLRRTLARRSGGDRIEVIESAVGATTGAALLLHNERHPADHRVVAAAGDGQRVESVPLVSLDAFLAERRWHPERDPVRFVKIDTQGYELQVCRGAERLLADSLDLIVALELAPAAIEEAGDDPQELWDLLCGHGYRAHLLDRRGTLRAVGRPDLEPLLAARGYTDLVLSRRPLSS